MKTKLNLSILLILFGFSFLNSCSTSKEDVCSIVSIAIGEQIWMAENLNTNVFRNGDTIKMIESDEEWVEAGENGIPAWCYYNNDPSNGEIYGKLYNWHAVSDSRGLAPKGWRVATEHDWDVLEQYLGENAGYQLKKDSLWGQNGGGNNVTGFSGLPGGLRFDNNGEFKFIEYYASWWTATLSEEGHAYPRSLSYHSNDIGKCNDPHGYGFYVRCVNE